MKLEIRNLCACFLGAFDFTIFCFYHKGAALFAFHSRRLAVQSKLTCRVLVAGVEHAAAAAFFGYLPDFTLGTRDAGAVGVQDIFAGRII